MTLSFVAFLHYLCMALRYGRSNLKATVLLRYFSTLGTALHMDLF